MPTPDYLSSYNGDGTSHQHISTLDASSTTRSGYETPTPYDPGNSIVVAPKVERKPSNFCHGGKPPHYGFVSTQIVGVLQGLIERLELLEVLPLGDTSQEPCIFFEPENEIEQDARLYLTNLLHDANHMHTLIQRKSKISKFSVETNWLKNVFEKTLSEILESGTFETLLDTCEAQEDKEKLTPCQIQHEKHLLAEMVMLNDQRVIEDEMEAKAEKERKVAFANLERELKRVKKAGKMALNYKIERVVAESDYARRVRCKIVEDLMRKVDQLEEDLEDEKKVSEFVKEYLKRQNMDLREEAIELAQDHDMDLQQLDVMLKRMKDKKWDREQLLAKLEPKYLTHSSESQAKAVAREEQLLLQIANRGVEEQRSKASLKIQKIWRGRQARVFVKKEKKKLKKKLEKEGKNKKKK